MNTNISFSSYSYLMVIKNCGTRRHFLYFNFTPLFSRPTYFQTWLYNATLLSPLESARVPYSNNPSHKLIVDCTALVSSDVWKVPQRCRVSGSSFCEYRMRPSKPRFGSLSNILKLIRTHQKSRLSMLASGVSINFMMSIPTSDSSPCSLFWHPGKRILIVFSSSNLGIIGTKKHYR